MLFTLALVLFILWALGAFAFHVGGGLIHLLLVLALIVIVYAAPSSDDGSSVLARGAASGPAPRAAFGDLCRSRVPRTLRA